MVINPVYRVAFFDTQYDKLHVWIAMGWNIMAIAVGCISHSIPHDLILYPICEPWCWYIYQHLPLSKITQFFVGKYTSTMVRINGIYPLVI